MAKNSKKRGLKVYYSKTLGTITESNMTFGLMVQTKMDRRLLPRMTRQLMNHPPERFLKEVAASYQSTADSWILARRSSGAAKLERVLTETFVSEPAKKPKHHDSSHCKAESSRGHPNQNMAWEDPPPTIQLRRDPPSRQELLKTENQAKTDPKPSGHTTPKDHPKQREGERAKGTYEAKGR
ncbi:hypothetical protein AOL_s00173g9 [Orbilia oligospora ATCC 24927]|uniref:Uncharacterized protein n=1 Tax=Arthrobotrys oligospora (strain ATCC 24927 / CBS 115.81 / DSM 1491) TaxID=756982 RepID=G1XNJ1_ARTOA|nr:hypothetical protein AOL_s00173g9 [Orbilia oligospora ATCC 24927]EGX44908.1 hypothetical protein AOL_s00173g9 [Orbilia oligospora ATCC 24927]